MNRESKKLEPGCQRGARKNNDIEDRVKKNYEDLGDHPEELHLEGMSHWGIKKAENQVYA